MNRKLVRPGATCLIALAAVLAGATIANAKIPDADGTVNGCVKSGNGQLYVIDRAWAKTCKKDAALACWLPCWNKPGAGGPQGLAGPQGFTAHRGPLEARVMRRCATRRRRTAAATARLRPTARAAGSPWRAATSILKPRASALSPDERRLRLGR